MEGMQEEVTNPITIYSDNTSAINIFKNTLMHVKKKNILIKYHYLRKNFQEKQKRFENVKSKEQIADIFTKPLQKDVFEYLRGKLGDFLLSKIH
jgi:isocitrate/isopropylmalate dehydrogenase